MSPSARVVARGAIVLNFENAPEEEFILQESVAALQLLGSFPRRVLRRH